MSSAGCIVFYKELVLLARRNENPGVSFPGYWSVFAGAIEGHETAKSCAIRELKEETCIEANEDRFPFVTTIYRGNKSLDLFCCRFKEIPDVNLNFEHTEYGWFKVEILDSFPYLIDEKMVEAIKLALTVDGALLD